jgi:hypothetical protein
VWRLADFRHKSAIRHRQVAADSAGSFDRAGAFHRLRVILYHVRWYKILGHVNSALHHAGRLVDG